MSSNLPARPWSLLQHNKDLDVAYRPVILCDAQGKEFLRIGHDEKALAIANAIVGAFSLLKEGVEAAEDVVDSWEEGDLAGAVNTLESWAEDAFDAL